MEYTHPLDLETVRRIAIFRALKLGDLLCTVPALRAMRAAYPQAEITLIGLPWAASFVDRFHKYLDDFIEFPGHPAFPERQPRIDQTAKFFTQTFKRKFDLAIQMHGSGNIANALIVLLGARQTAGFYVPGEYCPDESRYLIYPEHKPEIWRHLSLVALLGVPLQGDHLEFPLNDADREEYERLQAANSLHKDQYVVLHPGASSADKCWPPEKFALVGDALAQMGYQVVITGSQAERELAAAVRAKMRAPVVDLAGKTSLGGLAMTLQNSRLLVCNDTGVSHVAAALYVPSVVLFTNSEHHRWAPLNRELHRTITHAAYAIPEDVLTEAQALLQKGPIYAI